MKTTYLLPLFLGICWVTSSCQKEDNNVPTPVAKICMLATSTTDFANTKFTFDGQGRVRNAIDTYTDGSNYSIDYTFSYASDGQLTQATQRISENGKLIANQPLRFIYTDGLISKIENLCGCAANNVVQTWTLRYNANKQLIESTSENVQFNQKNTFVYDAKGNLVKETAQDNGIVIFEMNYTHADIKHPYQLIKGLPLNVFNGFKPWENSVIQTYKGFYVDENGKKQPIEASLSTAPLNAKGYPTAIKYSDGSSETYSFVDCD